MVDPHERAAGSGTLLDVRTISAVQDALVEQKLDAWLLFDFHGSNPVAAYLLGLGKTTRRGFVLVPAQGEPVALTHAIEASAWRGWPFARRTYAGWRELEAELPALLEGRRRVAMEVSPGASVPTLDLVPSGTVDFVRGLGVQVVSSGDLVTRFHSLWTPEQQGLHRRAAAVVEDVARRAFQRAADAVRVGTPTNEGALSDWIRGQLRAGDLSRETDCIVAVGPRAADPHYAPEGEGDQILAGSLLLIDLWGGHDGGVPADQTWMGLLDRRVDARTQEVWEAVRDARDAAVRFLRTSWNSRREVRGYEVDDVARRVIEARGFGEYFVHRTGHSIDVALHGSGPNLDNLETRDDRVLLPGVGFSVEPGIYIPGEIGMRTEINVFLGENGPEATPVETQDQLLLAPVD